VPFLLTTTLGLVPDGLARTHRIRRPSLPRHIDRLALHELRVADASIDLVFERVAHRAESVALTDVRIDGDVDVVLEIGPDRRELAPTMDRIRQGAGELSRA
jgi:hypothetical protein